MSPRSKGRCDGDEGCSARAPRPRPARTRAGLGLPMLALLLGSGSCTHEGLHEGPLSSGALQARGAEGSADPMVRGARMQPESVRDDRLLGVEPGGGLRGIAAGVRVVTLPNGAMLTADERLPQVPAITTALPERLGGGFLFILENVVWRAEHWLSEPRPIYTSPTKIQRVVPGLDRVYLRSQTGSHQAIDGRSGARLDLGPWPGSPHVGSYVAADGWRALAINDLRGAVATFDAGGTWRPVPLPFEAKEVSHVGDTLVVGDHEHVGGWYEVRPDGLVSKFGALPPLPPASSEASTGPRPFGKRPLLAAIEDGWPLTDGTALVARDGALGRIRLSDGALVEVATSAFPLTPSRCHPVTLARPSAVGAFGFVCGEVRGKTIIYAYDPRRGRLVEMRRFSEPRVVASSGNGTLTVHGPCAEAEGPRPKGDDPAQHAYCLYTRDETWRELNLRGEIGGERVVVLSDGRVAVISPPAGDLAMARMTLIDKGKISTVRLSFHGTLADPAAPIGADVARALRLGIWMDGFEERRPGVLGGWVDAGGSVLGLEIQLDGSVAHGAYIRDAGAPMVSGRYGLGWAASRRGFETTDGGMTWTPIPVPDVLAEVGRPERERESHGSVTSRACGPIGCNAAGWLRIGWGGSARPPPPDPPAAPRFTLPRASLTVALSCEALAPPPPPAPLPVKSHAGAAVVGQLTMQRAPWVTTPTLGIDASYELPPFYSVAPPTLHSDERGVSAEAADPIERYPRTGPLGRVYAWGPKTGDWEHTSRWVARWAWPYAGSQDVHSSQLSAPPQLLVEAAKFGATSTLAASWNIGVGDDGNHALLSARRMVSGHAEFNLFELETDRAPVELHRVDGEPFTDIEAAVRMGGHWFLAAAPAPGEMTAVVWQVDGPIARELIRIPRAGMDGRPSPPARLARRSDGRALGFVVDGQPSPDRASALRWVLPIDLEVGSAGEPELLGAADFGDHPTLDICGEADAGWVLDVPWSVSARLAVGSQDVGSMYSLLARVHVTPGHACLERIAGNLDGLGTERASRLTRSGAAPKASNVSPSLPVTAFAARSRYPLRCVYGR